MADSNPFSHEIHFEYGVATALLPGVRRLVADNPGPLTFKGTNVYILGQGEVAVLDPGPDCDRHIETLLHALPGERVTRIIVTHTHKDHSGGVARLRAVTGAKTYGFRPSDAARGAYRAGGQGELGETFADTDFRPDVPLGDGDVIDGDGWRLTAVHTPGHAPDHLCYALADEKALFTGDHIMPWSTSVIAPPEGRMSLYMASLDALMARDDALYLPGHGGRVRRPKRLLRAYILHRQWRETSILDALADGAERAGDIVPLLYKDLDPEMRPAATLSVLAHLEHLVEKGRAKRHTGAGLETVFALGKPPAG